MLELVKDLEVSKGKSKFRFPVNLQHFSTELGDAGGDSGEGDNNVENNNIQDDQNNSSDKNDSSGNKGKKTEGAKKVFYQEDVNSIAAKEAKKAQEKILKELGIEDIKSAKEGLAKLKEMQEAQKTDVQKAIEKATALEKKNSELASTNENLTAQLEALKANARPESLNDVVLLAKALVDEDTDISSAIAKVLEKYPNFKREEQEKEEEEEKPKFTKGKHGKEKPSEKDNWIQAFNWGRNYGADDSQK